MSPRHRLQFFNGCLFVSGILAALASATDISWLKYTVFILSVVAILIALWVVYAGPFVFRRVIPICKANMGKAWSVSKRCGGFYIGFFTSAVFAVFINISPTARHFLASANPWLLVTTAFFFSLPTAIHGFLRRSGAVDPVPNPSVRSVSGFLCGLGWFLAYLAFRAFFSK